jgi:hypothetical protein
VPELVTSGPRHFERGVRSGAGLALACEPTADSLDGVAGCALAGLDRRLSECAQAVRSAREALAARNEPVTLEALVREALVALPTPGARASSSSAAGIDRETPIAARRRSLPTGVTSLIDGVERGPSSRDREARSRPVDVLRR